MPRRPRYELPDGVYHVTARGTGGTMIFVDDTDRAAFTWLLGQTVALFELRVFAWCLLGTHFHLVVECPREQLSRAMHRLNGIYAQRFNKRHGRRGHLFEERFSAWLIESDEHLHAAILYVVQNPVAAGICHDSQNWIWSWPRLDNVSIRDARGTVPGARPKGAATILGGREQDDVHLAGAVHADDERLLDVRAPARPGDDREGARQRVADGGKQLLEPLDGSCPRRAA